MKNICLISSLPFWGGGEKLHLEMAKELRNRGLNVYFIAKEGGCLWKNAEKLSFQVFPTMVSRRSFLNIIKIITLIRFYRRYQIDTVLFSDSLDFKLGSISAKLAGLKRIVYLRAITLPIKARLFNRFLFNRVLTHLVAFSIATKESILLHLDKYLKKEKLILVYGGVEEKWITSTHKKSLPEIEEKGRGIILGNAARISKDKGQRYLVEIAERLKKEQLEFTIFIAGTGQEFEALASLIKEHGLEKEIIMLGFVEDMEAFMNSIDIFLMPTLREGCSNSILEAMAKQIPVISFNQSSMKEQITNDKTGFLVNYPDIDDFTEKTKILMDNPTLRSNGKGRKKGSYQEIYAKR